ncbi:amidase signature domain-containing protein [Nemania serpens]|nr:amidase signature domain-containing protein [Nemania serpens]
MCNTPDRYRRPAREPIRNKTQVNTEKIADCGSEHLFSVSGTDYIAPNSTSVVAIPSLHDVGLVTVFSLPHDNHPRISGEWIQSSVENYVNIDDVFNVSFLRTVVFHGAPEDQVDVTADAHGYQSPGGSSSGSAAAIASYDWLDIAIGTDTWGSVTRPSLWCGCFGFRPTWGSLPANGIEPFCQSWDTAGVLARDLQKCRDFSRAWLSPDKLKNDPSPFTSIIWPTDYWSIIESDQVKTAKIFVEKIKPVLALECTEVSFAAAWKQSPPSDAQDVTDLPKPSVSMRTTIAMISVFATNKCLAMLHTSPLLTKKMWSFAQNISKEGRDRDFARLHVFGQWFTQTVLTGNDYNALIIMPLESMTPRYRDEAPNFPRPPQQGVNALALAPVLKAPVVSIPAKKPSLMTHMAAFADVSKIVAELPYHSRITDREEMLPLGLAVMSPEGTDLALMDAMLRVMIKSGVPTVVKTGRSMFG